MNLLRVNTLDSYNAVLMGHCLMGNKLIYVTQKQLCVITIGKNTREKVYIKGNNVVNFTVSKRGHIALLFRNQNIQIRRIDSLSQILAKWTNIQISSDEAYPKLRWDYDQLFCIYANSIQILGSRDNSRKGYTDIVADFKNQNIIDMAISAIMQTERVVILQLRNKLVFSIIPIPISELAISNIGQMVTLRSTFAHHNSHRQYAIVLSDGVYIKIFNLLSLKQICQIRLNPPTGSMVQLQTDGNCQGLLVRYIGGQNMQIFKTDVYKINSDAYYCKTRQFFDQTEPFFNYCFSIDILQNLTPFPVTTELIDGQYFHSYRFTFFKDGRVYIVQQLIPNGYSQKLSQMKCRMGNGLWSAVVEWQDIISTCLQINPTYKQLSFSQQQRQLMEYNSIQEDFDNIIARFSQNISQMGRKQSFQNINVKLQWNKYLKELAKERNYMMETMEMFQMEVQFVPDKHVKGKLKKTIQFKQEKQTEQEKQIEKQEQKQKEKQKEKEKQKLIQKQKEKQIENQKEKQIEKQKQKQKSKETEQQELQKCMQQMQKRQQRLQKVLQDRRKQLQNQKIQNNKQLQQHQKVLQILKKAQNQDYEPPKPIQLKIAQNPLQTSVQTKPKMTAAQIQQYQQQYQKFVQGFMADLRIKQKLQAEQAALKVPSKSYPEALTLAMPQLNQQQRKLIQRQIESQSQDSDQMYFKSQHSVQNSISVQQDSRKPNLEHYLQQIEVSLSPLQQKLQQLIDKMNTLQTSHLEDIKRNQQEINKQCAIDLQQAVKQGFRNMMGSLTTKIKQGIQQTTHKLYKMEQHACLQNQIVLDKFKKFIKFQLQNRIDVFYHSRKRLEKNMAKFSKQHKEIQEQMQKQQQVNS